MTWAAKRKLGYFAGFVLAVALFVVLPIFALTYRKPSCMDKKQNQGELGVDCSGPCVLLCRNLELQPIVEWQQAFNVTSGVYTAVAYIHNPNLDGEASDVPYTFTVYGQNNEVIIKKSGVTYIPPGKYFPIIETGLVVGDRVPMRTFIDIDPAIVWHRAPAKHFDPAIENQILTNAKTSPVINADITNPTFMDLKQVYVYALVYDTDGNAFAASRTLVDHLDRQTTEHIVFTWPQPFTQSVSRIELIPIPR